MLTEDAIGSLASNFREVLIKVLQLAFTGMVVRAVFSQSVYKKSPAIALPSVQLHWCWQWRECCCMLPASIFITMSSYSVQSRYSVLGDFSSFLVIAKERELPGFPGTKNLVKSYISHYLELYLEMNGVQCILGEIWYNNYCKTSYMVSHLPVFQQSNLENSCG